MKVLRAMRPATKVTALGYLLAVSVLALAAQVTSDSLYYLAALVLTLPVGIAAVIGVYIGYGLVEQVIVLLLPHASGDRIDSSTMAVTAPVNVLLFAAAAVLDVLLVRHVVLALTARRSARRERHHRRRPSP